MPYGRIQHSGAAVPTTINGDITSGATSIVLLVATGWPDGATGPFYAVIDGGLSTEEKVLVTTRTSTTLNSVVRGVDGTSAFAHTSGATIAHIFSATEADEANQLVNETLGTITAKGDISQATGSGTLGKTAIGSPNTVFIADPAQATGAKWAQITASNIANSTITTTQLATNLQQHHGTFSGTTDGNGFFLFAHGAPFTPVACYVSQTGDGRAANVGVPFMFTVDATNVTLSYAAIRGSVVSLAVAGGFTVHP